MVSSDLAKWGLESYAWIDGYDNKNKEKKAITVTKYQINVKETKSATMNIFRNILFSF